MRVGNEPGSPANGLKDVKPVLACALLLVACSRLPVIDDTCPSMPAGTNVSCDESVALASRFAEQEGISAEVAKVEFIRSFGVAEGTGRPGMDRHAQNEYRSV